MPHEFRELLDLSHETLGAILIGGLAPGVALGAWWLYLRRRDRDRERDRSRDKPPQRRPSTAKRRRKR